ncbi:DUF1127 domain-containing protein [Yoonia sp.]|uniref:DUF1127 domain-containing protein n=1 Tax=Yoonia sp. TaxID=2212373 RepID=UPI003A4DF4B9|nr:DUF1127 domain-containing protein [Loktanella sp.]
MAIIETNRTAAGVSAGRVTSVFASIMGAIATWNDARVTRNALSKLSARELDDIGLCFSDIDRIATRGAR